MVVAINACFINPKQSASLINFIQQTVEQLSQQHPHHSFVLIGNDSVFTALPTRSNLQTIKIRSGANNLLSYKWLYNVTISSALKRCKADAFITHTRCSTTTSVPQVLIINGSSKSFSGTAIKKAKIINTISQTLKDQLLQEYKVDEMKIINVQSAANSTYQPVTWQQKELVKDKYAEGCEFFIFIDSNDKGTSFLTQLKAFSIFKKWQKTNMKLVVINHFAFKESDEKLKSYKYRKEIVLINNPSNPEIVELITAAYCLLITGSCQPLITPILEAMQSEIAVISTHDNYIKEVAADSVMYTTSDEPEAIAEQMKRIFKDEHLRSELIVKGRLQAAQFTWQKTANVMWQSIEKAVFG